MQMKALQSPPPPPDPSTALSLILQLLPVLLLRSVSPKTFASRWHSIRSKLSHLQSSLSQIDFNCPSSHNNPLLQQLLPNILATVQKTQTLSRLCSDTPPSGGTPPSIGKLHLQSDLDIASSSLSLHLHDLDLLLKSGLLSSNAAAIVLSHPGPASSNEDLTLFVRDLFARLQIGGLEFKKKALDSLLLLLREDGDEKNACVVSAEGDLPYLIHLLDAGSYPSCVREQAVAAVALLTAASDSCKKILFEEGVLGPLLRLLESSSSNVREKAAAAVYAITIDPENGWAISAYGGIPALIDACRFGSPATRCHASGTMRNVARVEDVQRAMADEGAVPVLVELLAAEGAAAGNAVKCLAILASAGEEFRVLIMKEDGLQKLLHLVQETSNGDTLEHALRAIQALSSSAATARALSSSMGFILLLAEVIKQGNPALQQISASLLCSLPLGDTSKRAASGCMGPLVKMLELPKPVGVQEVAGRALVSLLLSKANRKVLARDEKSLTRLVLMLDPKNEGVCKKFPLMVVSALLLGGGGARKRLSAAGAVPHLQSLADMDVAGSKKILQKLAGNRLKKIFTRTWRD